ncbi:cell division protein FtsQ/DivIB [Idiomarina xiamenensis]|uniref:Cell division protein FtsQ n=1 Tax=Idiomarina xiamenensis 10-D-4 TaxID=740709 RepID=K2JPA9_9GAMM|nr:cell division protein FtsQ/DivIB [Idiomarina xiamenensis]EKE85331.1 cell division septal protein [Idiomarina xiamenensis 10-D-4]
MAVASKLVSGLGQWRKWRWSFWFGLMFFVAVVAATILGSWQLYQLLNDEQEVPLRQLNVQGELQYVTVAEVREALLSDRLGSFFSADVDVLRQRVEALPWVATASVRKVWPDKLAVFVVEQQALAVWNDSALLNQAGQLFDADRSRLQQPLPALFGPTNAVAETLQQYRDLQQLLAPNQFQIRALRLSPRFATEVVLSNGIELRLGREANVERIQRFIDLYPVIVKQRERDIDYIDLRYDTGVAVSWRETEDKVE